MADITTDYTAWSTTESSNQPAGTTTVGTGLDDNLRAIQAGVAQAIADAKDGTLALTTPALGTPASGVLTNCTGLPISTGVAGLGANVATFLATPSSANLAAAVTGETGSGALVFATSPTLVTPALGTPASGNLANCTPLAASDTVAGALEIAIQSEMVTGSSTTLAVTPGRQHFHSSAAKGWVHYNQTTPQVNQSYNVTSVTDNDTGDFTVNWANDFSTASHAIGGMAGDDNYLISRKAQAAGTAQVTTRVANTAALTDLTNNSVIAFGPLA